MRKLIVGHPTVSHSQSTTRRNCDRQDDSPPNQKLELTLRAAQFHVGLAENA